MTAVADTSSACGSRDAIATMPMTVSTATMMVCVRRSALTRGSCLAEGGTVTVKHSVGGMMNGVTATTTPTSATVAMMLSMMTVIGNRLP